MTSKTGRKPDYRLKAMDMQTNSKNIALGAGWINENGSISIKIDPCVRIEYDPDMLITLFLIGKDES